MTAMAKSSVASKRSKIAGLLAGGRCVIAGSVFDPLSARIAEDVGFECGMLGGSGASLAVLGAPDIALLTLTELVDLTRRICRASDIPVLVDADDGYGNALNVMRAVEDLGNAGACGLSIEDILLPRAFGSAAETRLVSVEEAEAKMRAAVDAARGGGPAIFGRTAALVVTGLDDAITRLQAYERTGVDALFVPYVKGRAQLDAIAARTRLPIVLGGPGAEIANDIDLDYLSERRVRICLLGHHGIAAAAQAIHEVARAMYEGRPLADLRGFGSEALMSRLSRAEEFEKLGRAFLQSNPPDRTRT